MLRGTLEGTRVCRVTGLKDWPSEVGLCGETCRAAGKLGAAENFKPLFVYNWTLHEILHSLLYLLSVTASGSA